MFQTINSFNQISQQKRKTQLPQIFNQQIPCTPVFDQAPTKKATEENVVQMYDIDFLDRIQTQMTS